LFGLKFCWQARIIRYAHGDTEVPATVAKLLNCLIEVAGKK
jgi:hypothetical protein